MTSANFFFFSNHYFSGANQLLWYYADLEKKRCYANMAEESATTESFLSGNISKANISGYANPIQQDINHCLAWRRFAK